jgi:hypothetical protein
MNLSGFTPCNVPLSKIQELENKVVELEKQIEKIIKN